MIRFAFPLVLLATAGCQQPSAPEPTPPPPGKCVADNLGRFTGKTRSDAIEKKALRLSGSSAIRWISPGMAVTMDFREDRLNFDLDAQGRITGARCG